MAVVILAFTTTTVSASLLSWLDSEVQSCTHHPPTPVLKDQGHFENFKNFNTVQSSVRGFISAPSRPNLEAKTHKREPIKRLDSSELLLPVWIWHLG